MKSNRLNTHRHPPRATTFRRLRQPRTDVLPTSTAGRIAWPGSAIADSTLDTSKLAPWNPRASGIDRGLGAERSSSDEHAFGDEASRVPWNGLPRGASPLPGLGPAAENEMDVGKLSTPPVSATPLANTEQAGGYLSKRAGLLIVDRKGKGENEFGTLAEALNAALSGDVIELRYSGPREEKPINLANHRVTIRAGEGCRPVVVFRPTEADPIKSPRSMLTASGGRLTLINVAVQFHVPREVPADNWSLLETRGEQVVRLEKCAFSIENASEQLGAYHQDVAFFRVKAAPGADVAAPDFGSASAPTATIDLIDCVACGEGVLLRAEDLQPVHLTWNNGLLATTERLLSVTGDPRTPPAGGALHLDLRHLTAVVRSGLCRIAWSQTAPHPLPLQLACTDSILTGGGALFGTGWRGRSRRLPPTDHLERRPELLRGIRRLLVDVAASIRICRPTAWASTPGRRTGARSMRICPARARSAG